MKFVDRIRPLLTRSALIYAVIAVVALIALWFFFFRGDGALETLTVTRGDFLEQVSVSGTVVAAQNVDLGWSGGGRVSRVYARVGDTVAYGSVIAEVENGDLRANLLQKQAALETEEAQLAARKEGTRSEEIAVTEAAIANDRLALNEANEAVVNAIRDAYTTADDSIRNQVDQFINSPRSSSPQLNFQTSDTSLSNKVANGRIAMEQLLLAWQGESNALTALSDLDAASSRTRSNLSAVSSFLVDVSAALNRAISNSSVTQSNINDYITDVAGARTSVNTALSTLTTKLSSRASAQATLTKDEKTLALQRAGTTQADIAAQEAQVKSARAEVENARAQLQKTIIVAPFSGTVTKMDAKVGAIVSANTSEISIMSSGTFQIESFVPEVNVARLTVGDPAETTLDAYGEKISFPARIVSIDPAQTLRDGVSTYKTILEFLSADPRIRSGMTANVVITTEKKSDTISIPQGIIIERDGKKFVPIQRGDATIEVEVETGSVSSLGNIEILQGLEEGDVVILSEGGV